MDEGFEAFEKWLASYRAEVLGGSLAHHFLSAVHLRAAFEAGRAAERARA